MFDRASTKLYNLASIVDNLASPLTIGSPVEEAASQDEGGKFGDGSNERTAELEAAESRLKPIQEYATSVTFAPKLDNGLYLVGAGVRKKSVVKVYAVGINTFLRHSMGFVPLMSLQLCPRRRENSLIYGGL